MTAHRSRLVYVAGPMTTSGEPGPNLHAACDAAAELLLRGFTPLVPHLSWIAHAIRPDVPAELWMGAGLVLVERSSAVLRLPGRSVGSDIECERAQELGIPVYESVAVLVSVEETRRRLGVANARAASAVVEVDDD